MKKLSVMLCLLLSISNANNSFGQNEGIKRVNIGMSDNLNLWLPGNFLNKDSDLNPKKRSNTFTGYTTVTLINRERFILKVGPAYKRVGYTIKDRIETYKITTQKPGDPPVTTIYKIPTDYKARSLNLGLMLTLERKLTTIKPMYLGLGLELYCVEFYKAGFIEPELQGAATAVPFMPDKMYPFYDRFNISNTTASLIYTYYPGKIIGLKGGLGMNIYSAWDQFSKYAFLSLGLEIGLGQKINPTNK